VSLLFFWRGQAGSSLLHVDSCRQIDRQRLGSENGFHFLAAIQTLIFSSGTFIGSGSVFVEEVLRERFCLPLMLRL
jgi:hypothetical protein